MSLYFLQIVFQFSFSITTHLFLVYYFPGLFSQQDSVHLRVWTPDPSTFCDIQQPCQIAFQLLVKLGQHYGSLPFLHVNEFKVSSHSSIEIYSPVFCSNECQVFMFAFSCETSFIYPSIHSFIQLTKLPLWTKCWVAWKTHYSQEATFCWGWQWTCKGTFATQCARHQNKAPAVLLPSGNQGPH